MKKSAHFIFLLVLLACKTQPESKIAIGTLATLDAAREIMTAGTCTLVTVNDLNQPYARVMEPLDPDKDFVVWLATNPLSRKVFHIEANPNVVLHYVDQVDNGYVSLYGKAELVRDSTLFNNHWKPEWNQFYRNKNTDCVLIKVVPARLEVIHYMAGITGDPLTWQPTVITF
ncbi:MAG: pyridoxamine 5'-phosphate oxidase family protein [Cyclobacteriaceae bacterium]|nr:pyridoxamine 5'-phosphate oxidase family protein [Cyclobacteriaceae bacterium]